MSYAYISIVRDPIDVIQFSRQHNWINSTQQTQNIFITVVQRRPNVFDVGPTLCKCHKHVLCLLGIVTIWQDSSEALSAKFRLTFYKMGPQVNPIWRLPVTLLQTEVLTTTVTTHFSSKWVTGFFSFARQYIIMIIWNDYCAAEKSLSQTSWQVGKSSHPNSTKRFSSKACNLHTHRLQINL